jgi:hypothetical protein
MTHLLEMSVLNTQDIVRSLPQIKQTRTFGLRFHAVIGLRPLRSTTTQVVVMKMILWEQVDPILLKTSLEAIPSILAINSVKKIKDANPSPSLLVELVNSSMMEFVQRLTLLALHLTSSLITMKIHSTLSLVEFVLTRSHTMKME